MFSLPSTISPPINGRLTAAREAEISPSTMAKAPITETPSLTDLRREIDRIDEAMHALLIERGEIIGPSHPGQKHERDGLGFPPRAGGDHDAAAGRAPSRHPSP